MRLLLEMCAVLAPILLRAEIKAFPCDYRGWAQDTFERRDGVKIVGDQNRYAVHLVSEKPKAGGDAVTCFQLTEPRRMWGFGQNGPRFLDVKVNGIPLSKTVVSDRTFRHEKDGATLHLNFDGAAVDLRVFMKRNSPLLWFALRPAKEQLRPIESISFSLHCFVSDYRAKASDYGRYVKTAVRALGPDKALRALTAEDRYLILGDSKLDGSGPGKGYGPNYIDLGDSAAVKKAVVHADNAPEVTVSVELRPNFEAFTFAILQSQGAVTEAQLRTMLGLPEGREEYCSAVVAFAAEKPVLTPKACPTPVRAEISATDYVPLKTVTLACEDARAEAWANGQAGAKTDFDILDATAEREKRHENWENAIGGDGRGVGRNGNGGRVVRG